VIFFGPHHDGTAAAFAAFEDFADDAVAVSRTAPHASASANSTPLFFLLIVRASLFELLASVNCACRIDSG
jgi:hypothetical protein